MNDKDKYSHNDLSILYVAQNILGPMENTLENEVLRDNYNSTLIESCTCNQTCEKEFCNCLKMSREDNYYKNIFEGELSYVLHHKSYTLKDYPIIECNSNCTCSSTCRNRIVQNGPIKGLFVNLCKDERKEMGLFTSIFICKGTFICEYAGELLTKTQAMIRATENEVQGNINYIFCVNEHIDKSIIQTFVDPSKFGNIGRYINHSCEPNSLVLPVRSETIIPHIAIFALVDIYPGQEITYNYGSSRQAGPDLIPHTKIKECYCNAPSCQKVLPYENF